MEGIVLATYPSGDKDIIARILTLESGKISVFVRRNRAQQKHSVARIEALDRGYFDFTEKRGDLHTLRNFKPQNSHPQIRSSLARLSVAACILEATDALLPDEGGAEPLIFEVVTSAFDNLSRAAQDSDALKICFDTIAALLTHCGYAATDMFGTASVHSLRRIIFYLEQSTERTLRSKQLLEETLTHFVKHARPA